MFFVDFEEHTDIRVHKPMARILIMEDNTLIQIADSFNDVNQHYLDNSRFDYILCGEDGSNFKVDNIKSPDEYRVLA